MCQYILSLDRVSCFVLGQESRRQEQRTDRSDKTVTRKHGPFLEDLLTPAPTPDPTGPNSRSVVKGHQEFTRHRSSDLSSFQNPWVRGQDSRTSQEAIWRYLPTRNGRRCWYVHNLSTPLHRFPVQLAPTPRGLPDLIRPNWCVVIDHDTVTFRQVRRLLV